jgi:hypothetical protein
MLHVGDPAGFGQIAIRFGGCRGGFGKRRGQRQPIRTWWWSPLPFIAFASYRCFAAIFQEETKLGPAALEFYAEYGGQNAREARAQLLSDLDASRRKNTERATEKSKVLKQALRILFVGLFIAGALIVFATPSKVGSDVCSHPAKTCRTATRSGSSTVESAGGWDARRYWIAPPPVH